MKNAPAWLARVVNVATTVATAALPTLVEEHVISLHAATLIGSVVAALAAGHHANNAAVSIAARSAQPQTQVTQ